MEQNISVEFINHLRKYTKLSTLEANLSLEQLSRMNEVAKEKYDGLDEQCESIRTALEEIRDNYVIAEPILQELTAFGAVLDKLEENVSVLEDMTSRIESKFK